MEKFKDFLNLSGDLWSPLFYFLDVNVVPQINLTTGRQGPEDVGEFLCDEGGC